jgi:shikimate kinase
MILKLKRTPGIYLVGFMGCGKSTIGRLLADELGWPFADLDEDIESERRISISEIFEQSGEAEFRKMESEALGRRVKAIETGRPLVLALGGGAFTQPGNVALLRANGITIWLDCPLEVVQRRVARSTHRPLASDPDAFAALFHKRIAAYAKAEYCIAVDDAPPSRHVTSILRLPIF